VVGKGNVCLNILMNYDHCIIGTIYPPLHSMKHGGIAVRRFDTDHRTGHIIAVSMKMII